MRNLGRVLLFCAVLSFAPAASHAQVDRSELERRQAPVNFVNFEGPIVRNETREQIRQIGVALGQAIAAGQAQTGALNRYFVIHSVSPADGDRLDADIFGIGAAAAVDHIRNVRTIVQGYLQAAYNYSEADAALLALFVSVYNAVNRGDWDFISERYKDDVLRHLTPQNAGISVRFDEWAGQTRMLIPLTGLDGLSAIDTAAISDPRVIDELRREDGMGIGERRDLVDLMEREAEEAEARAAALREAAEAEQRAIAEERARLELAQQQREQDAAAGAVTPAQAAQAEAEQARREQELAAREAALAAQQAEAARQEQLAEERFDGAQWHRDAIAQDQQVIIAQAGLPPQALPARQGLITVVIERQGGAQGGALGRLVSFDPVTRAQRRSPLSNVHARTLTFVGGRLIAIAGERVGQGAVRLIEVDTATLEMLAQGEDDIHPGSLIWLNGAYLYAITADHANGGALSLGRFDANLVLQARSEVALHPNASVSIQQGSLLTQRSDGSAALLHPASLAEN